MSGYQVKANYDFCFDNRHDGIARLIMLSELLGRQKQLYTI